MARVAILKEAIKLCIDAKVTSFIWGHRGCGKSSIIRQVAAANGWGLVDFRCSQVEASDIRGLPDRADGRTIFLPPADMPIADLTPDQVLELLLEPFRAIPSIAAQFKGKDSKIQHDILLRIIAPDDPEASEYRRIYDIMLHRLQPRFQNGILFLDELNRAQDDVQQATFQLVLDRRVGQYVLPDGWGIVVAGNYNEGYQVSGFTDAAFLDRFCHLVFSIGDTTLEDWIYYMSNVHGAAASAVIEFASQNVKHLDGETPGSDLGFSIQPSRRSWDAVVRVEQVAAAKGYASEIKLEVVAGLVGREMANSYIRYNCPVKPGDLLARGVRAYAAVLGTLERGQMIGLMWGLVSSAKPRINVQQVADVCLDFAEWMVNSPSKDKDLCVAFCRALVSTGAGGDQEKARAAVISNPRLASMIGKFNVKHSVEKSFIDMLNSRPKLQEVLAKVAWGMIDNNSD